MPKEEPFKCPLGDPKVTCDHVKRMHYALVKAKSERMEHQLALTELSCRLVFLKDGLNDLAERINKLKEK